MNNFAWHFLKEICQIFAVQLLQKLTLKQTPHLTVKADAIQDLPWSLKVDEILGGSD